ncbi:MAG: hypothetical protein PWQ63_762 [Methanolobus sp.]|nr:hypothetical protein [Methanolobus sp.]MDK2947602.1 hypothetical protein [Methanolobus sp.]
MTAWKMEKIQKQHQSALPVEKVYVTITVRNLNFLYPLDNHLMYRDCQRDCQEFFANTVLIRQLKTDSINRDGNIPDFIS